jgi:hypothetical protein
MRTHLDDSDEDLSLPNQLSYNITTHISSVTYKKTHIEQKSNDSQ